MLLPVSVVGSFLWLSSIPSCGCTAQCSSVPRLKVSSVASGLGRLLIKLLYASVCGFCVILFSFLQGKYPGVEITAEPYGKGLFNVLGNWQTVLHHFAFPPERLSIPFAPHPCLGILGYSDVSRSNRHVVIFLWF